MVMNKQISLPKGEPTGYGNLVYLFSNSVQDSVKLMNNTENCQNLNHAFKFYYYNLTYSGRLYNKRYLCKDVNERKEAYNLVKRATSVTPFPLRPISGEFHKNTYYELSRYLEIFNTITGRIQPKIRMRLFWNYLKNIIDDPTTSGFSKKYILINASQYGIKFDGKLQEKIANPLFLIYYTLYVDYTILKNVNIDFLIYAGKYVMKFNPSLSDKKTVTAFKAQLKRLMSHIVSSDTFDKATNADEILKEEQIAQVSDAILNKTYHFTGKDKDEVITNTELEKVANANKPSSVSKSKVNDSDTKEESEHKVENRIANKTQKVQEELEKTTGETPSEDEVAQKTEEEINNDKELLEDMYRAAMKNNRPSSPASTARDKLIREKQEELKVGNLTISEIRKIDAKHTPIAEKDVSKVIKTTNESMRNLKFVNFEKTYNEKLMTKDLVGAFTELNDKSIPMSIIKIDVKDTSDELNYKDTYTVVLEDVNRQRHTITVDIPKFIDNKFLWIGGSKKLILKQNFLLPVVKSGPDEVQIVTNYNKMFIRRIGTKSTSSVERIIKMMKDNEEIQKYFTMGNAYVLNIDFITSVEYDEFSRRFMSFKCGDTEIIFDQNEIQTRMNSIGATSGDEDIVIGFRKKTPIIINMDTQQTENGKTVSDIIVESLPENLQAEYYHTKPPKRLMYAGVTTMNQQIAIGILLAFWEGFGSLMQKADVVYRLESRVPKELANNEETIKFNNCTVVYKADTVTKSLLMNGFSMFDFSQYNIEEMETPTPYLQYFVKVYGKANIANALMNSYEFTIDHITREVLEDMSLPTKIVELCIYAVSLLSDSQYTSELNQNFSRIRSNEIIPAILYDAIAKQYIHFKNSNGSKKLSLPRDIVIKNLLAVTTVEDNSTLNPILELERSHVVMHKGYKGANLDDFYTQDRRVYEKSMIGTVGMATSPDGAVGVQKVLTMEPPVNSARGYVDIPKDVTKLKDINVFSPGEILCPLGVTNDDPTRTGHAIKQSKHVIPVKKSSPVLISNGAEEICRFGLSSDFVINAKMDGKVVEVDEKLGLIVCEYKDGTHQAINLNPNIVKNGGGGFYLSNRMITNLKLGSTFKKDEMIAWHKDFFTSDPYTGNRFNMGTLTKFAIISTYANYEDSTFITHKMADEMSTEMCFNKQVVIGKNASVDFIASEGAELAVGDSLIQFDTSYEDNELNMLLDSIGENLKEGVLEDSRNDIKTKWAGTIECIKMYSTVEFDELSPSLQKIFKKYYSNINDRKKLLEKYDKDGSIVKCGILLDQSTKKVDPNRFGVIKGQKVEDSVLIEFYIKHKEMMEVGSKLAVFTGLKNTVGEIIPKGYEPYSEFRPDEEISTSLSPYSILKRMTPSITLTMLGNKCIIELKRHLKVIYDSANGQPIKDKMTSVIYKFFNAFDQSKTNTKKYKALFDPMSEQVFKNWFKGFFSDENAYLILDIADYVHTVKMEDIERAAKVINIPLFEYVYLPFITMDKNNVVCTKVPCAVGYAHIKRTQQTVAKKNGLSTSADIRSAVTGQVTGADKNGRESDLENAMLVSMGMTNTLRELNGPRADDLVMKREMLANIARDGYLSLDDLTDDVSNKTALNTVNTYLLGMSIDSDLITKGLMLDSTLRDELR